MAQGRPVVGNSMMLCPAAHCGHLMELDSRAGYDVRTGLDYLHCRRCGHRGMRARDGVQLLFTGQHEYVFSYGPSLSCLKVVLSTVALNQFRVQGLTSVQLATHVAEWALLMGQVVTDQVPPEVGYGLAALAFAAIVWHLARARR